MIKELIIYSQGIKEVKSVGGNFKLWVIRKIIAHIIYNKKPYTIYMKTIITILSIFISTVGFSQKVDTVRNSIQITPIVTNVMKADTAYQLFWRISVDRGSDNTGYGVMYDRVGNKVYDFNFTVPKEIINKLLDDKVIDDFILTKYNLSIRK